MKKLPLSGKASNSARTNRHMPLRTQLSGLAALLGLLTLTACSDHNSTIDPSTGVARVPGTAAIAPVTRTDLATLPPVEPPVESRQVATTVGGGAPLTKPLKIGLILPLGGFDQTAAVAKGMKQAAELALFEAEGSNVQLIVKDDKGSADGARAATDEAIHEGAEIILGPLFGRAVAGAAPVARSASIPILTFSNDSSIAGNGVYVLGFLPTQDVERIVAYASAQGKKRFAALVPDDGYGQLVGAAFKQAVTQAGGMVVASETYPSGANAMLGPSRRIVEAIKAAALAGSPIDAVFMPGGQDVLSQLGPLMAYSGFDAGKVKLLGSGAWEFSNIGNNDTFVGGWYPAPDPQGWRAFSGRFIKAYAQPPPRLASLAYDGVKIAISLASNGPPGQRFSQATLTRPAGFTGVDGLLRFKPDGLGERALAVIEVRKIGSTVLDAAPLSFDSLAPTTPKGDSAKLSTATGPERVN